MKYHITFEDFQNALQKHYQIYGRSASFSQMMDYLYRENLLSSAPVKPPRLDLCDDLSDDDFIHMLNQYPITADMVRLKKHTSAFEESTVIPDDKDVFVLRHFKYINNSVHSHDYFEIDYVFHGSCQFFFENSWHTLHAGEMCIIAPSSKHDIQLDRDEATVLTILLRKSTFDQSFFSLLSGDNLLSYFFKNLLYEKPHSNYLLFFTQNPEPVKKLLKNLALESCKSDSYSNNCCISWINLLFSIMLRNYTETVQFYQYTHGSDFSLILQYVQHHYQHLTLRDLAHFFHYSEAHLSTLFKKNTGHSYTDLIRRLKMRDAVRYLISTDMSILEISEKAGYHSADHFSRTFNSYYGVSPQVYRKKNRELPLNELK